VLSRFLYVLRNKGGWFEFLIKAVILWICNRRFVVHFVASAVRMVGTAKLIWVESWSTVKIPSYNILVGHAPVDNADSACIWESCIHLQLLKSTFIGSTQSSVIILSVFCFLHCLLSTSVRKLALLGYTGRPGFHVHSIVSGTHQPSKRWPARQVEPGPDQNCWDRHQGQGRSRTVLLLLVKRLSGCSAKVAGVGIFSSVSWPPAT